MKPTQQPQAIGQRFVVLLAGVLLPLSATCGCSSMSNTGQGIAGGAVVGGFFGTLLGLAAGRPLEGAAAGAAIGGTVGGVSGAAEDGRDRRVAQSVAAAQQRGYQELSEVAKMHQAGVNDAVIIQHVQTCGAIFNLTSDQIVWLKQQGISDPVIQTMQYTSGPVPVYGPGYGRPRYVYVQPVQQPVVVEQPPPPGATVGVGMTYARTQD